MLENGPSSVYARFFDINWHPVKTELKNKILVPVLGDQYGEVLENQELRARLRRRRVFCLVLGLHVPLAGPTPTSRSSLTGMKELEAELRPTTPHYIELLSINTALVHLPRLYGDGARKQMAERNREKEIAKRRLAESLRRKPGDKRASSNENVRYSTVSRASRRASTFSTSSCGARPSGSPTGGSQPRRSTTGGSSTSTTSPPYGMEDPAVFEETHRLVFRLIREGKVTGLRVDHPDGLYDPPGTSIASSGTATSRRAL